MSMHETIEEKTDEKIITFYKCDRCRETIAENGTMQSMQFVNITQAKGFHFCQNCANGMIKEAIAFAEEIFKNKKGERFLN